MSALPNPMKGTLVEKFRVFLISKIIPQQRGFVCSRYTVVGILFDASFLKRGELVDVICTDFSKI